MVTIRRIAVLVLIGIAFTGSPAHAWDSRGHMMVAAVAYQNLTPKTRDRVDALLALNPDRENWLELIPANTSPAKAKMMLFLIAATWPDRIKRNKTYHADGPHRGNRPPTNGTADNNIGYSDMAMHKYWHFIDQPFSEDGTALPPVPVPNAVTQIAAFRAVIASSNRSDELKSYDLCWLLHLVGDIHQPLHVAMRISAALPEGDNGGNSIKLSGAPNNLHAFWDDILGTGDSPSAAAKAAAKLPKATKRAGADLNVQHWVAESFVAAQKTAYRNPPIGKGEGPFTPDPKYKAAVRKLAEKRVALAGTRLAKILNDELK